MPIWLLIIIISSGLTFIFLTLLAIACIKFDYRLKVERMKVDALLKENKHQAELMNAYGIKEINIGGDNE